jgi:hypothetical protein
MSKVMLLPGSQPETTLVTLNKFLVTQVLASIALPIYLADYVIM